MPYRVLSYCMSMCMRSWYCIMKHFMENMTFYDKLPGKYEYSPTKLQMNTEYIHVAATSKLEYAELQI